MKMDIISLDGTKSGSIDLPKDIFGVEVRKDLLHRAVVWQQAAKRQGSANTKTRGEINRTNSKIYRQKGTGNARHGSRRVNIFRGGSVVFGPRPRDFSISLPKKVRALALKTALSAKVGDKKVLVLDEAKAGSHKTKDLAKQLSKLEAENALFIVDSLDENFDKASRNLPHVKVVPTEGVNVYDILRRDKLVVTKAAVPMLAERLAARGGKDDDAKKEK